MPSFSSYRALHAAALVAVISLLACGEETIEQRVNRELHEAMTGIDIDSLGESFRRAAGDIDLDSVEISGLDDVEVIPFRDLKTLMPKRVGGILNGLPREAHFGETRKVLGVRYSVAEATYVDGERRVEATLTDAGGGGRVIKGLLGFSGFEVDKETAEGSERTFELDGHKAYEKVRTRGGELRTELQVLVNDRFIVSLKGTDVEASVLTDAFGDFDLAALPEAPADDE